ncbi:MAG: TlpA disulfide reductase family protein [Acidobacteriaceae bacterium]
MAALIRGAAAPIFVLPALDGEAVSLLPLTRTVLLFFKSACPTCRYAIPFFERLYLTARGVKFLGISQDDTAKTREFVQRCGISFPVLIEDAPRYTASNAYGLTNVPTVFLVSAEGVVEFSSVGWARQDIDGLSHRIARLPLFQPGEAVADFKAG